MRYGKEAPPARRQSFEVAGFVELNPQFMDALGIGSVPIMGHSMGGTTALGVALKYPERVTKVAVVGSPLDGRSLSFFLKLAGRRTVASLMLAGDSTPLLRLFLRLWSPCVSPRNVNLFYTMTCTTHWARRPASSESLRRLTPDRHLRGPGPWPGPWPGHDGRGPGRDGHLRAA